MSTTIIMEQPPPRQRTKDRNYKNVFKGSVLVATLMDHDSNRFTNRDAAVKFAQKLLDANHIESIVGSKEFEDSVHLYRWKDESVVKEAKKMVSSSSAHIPRRKLIELVDFSPGDGSEDAFMVKDVKEKISVKKDQVPNNVTAIESTQRVRRERVRRRQTHDSCDINPENGCTDEMEESNLSKTISKSAEGIDIKQDVRRRRSCNPSPDDNDLPYDDMENNSDQVNIKNKRNRSNSLFSSPTPLSPSDSNNNLKDNESDNFSKNTCTINLTNEYNGMMPSTVHIESDRKTSFQADSSGSFDETNKNKLYKSEVTPPITETNDYSVISTNNTNNNHEFNQHFTNEQSHDSNINSAGSEVIFDHNTSPNIYIPMSDDQKYNDHHSTLDGTATSAYDGGEIPSLKIENFQSNRPQISSEALNNLTLEQLKSQSHNFTDIEKHLLDKLERLSAEHARTIQAYEQQIRELQVKLNDTHYLSELIEMKRKSPNDEIMLFDKLPILTTDTEETTSDEAPVNKKAIPKPPTIPQAPPPPSSLTLQLQVAKPTKPVMTPNVKMRPLFWNRILLENQKSEALGKTFWDTASEPSIDMEDLERLFGKKHDQESAKAKSLHDAIVAAKGRANTAKLLDENRSRTVGIKLRSMHCQMSDIQNSVYNMDFNHLDLDTLNNLYEIRGTKDELESIEMHIKEHEDIPLDQPEQFLLELSFMSHFPERLECMMLRKRFNENLFNIDQQLNLVQAAGDDVMTHNILHTILELTLAFGNYMNGGTQRGQADGFQLSILPKLKDVKSMDNNLNLLHYLVRVFMRDYEEDAGRNDAIFKLPDHYNFYQASQVSFDDIDEEISKLQHQINTHCKKAELVYADTDPELLQPFKDQMEDFFDTADEMLKRQQEKLDKTRATFQNLIKFFSHKDTTEQVTLNSFHGIWQIFICDYKHYWHMEQRRVAREMFEKVEQKRKDRIRSARRRKSEIDKGKSNLKQKFQQMRRRSDKTPHTVRQLKSQSSSEESHRQREKHDMEEESLVKLRRRKRSNITEEISQDSETDVSSMSESSTPTGDIYNSPVSETMAQRMERRRRTQHDSQDVQRNIPRSRARVDSNKSDTVFYANGDEQPSSLGNNSNCTDSQKTQSISNDRNQTFEQNRRRRRGADNDGSSIQDINATDNSKGLMQQKLRQLGQAPHVVNGNSETNGVDMHSEESLPNTGNQQFLKAMRSRVRKTPNNPV